MSKILKTAFSVIEHKYDVVVLGAGGSGLKNAHMNAQRTD